MLDSVDFQDAMTSNPDLLPDDLLAMTRPAVAIPVHGPNRRHPLPGDWVQFRDVIVDLYMREEMTLPQVRRHMASAYGFMATLVDPFVFKSPLLIR